MDDWNIVHTLRWGMVYLWQDEAVQISFKSLWIWMSQVGYTTYVVFRGIKEKKLVHCTINSSLFHFVKFCKEITFEGRGYNIYTLQSIFFYRKIHWKIRNFGRVRCFLCSILQSEKWGSWLWNRVSRRIAIKYLIIAPAIS